MRVAIMQPYFLPYMGYWELLQAADIFVLLDDVNFITRGWINRNRIASAKGPLWLTIPLKKASQNRLILDLCICEESNWRHSLESKIRHYYREAPQFEPTMQLIQMLLREPRENLSDYLALSISRIIRHLDIDTKLVNTSRHFDKRSLRGQDRIIDICLSLGATEYINLPGGIDLYDKTAFLDKGIDLRFLKNKDSSSDLHKGLGPNDRLSIVDDLMWNPTWRIQDLLRAYEFQE